MEMESLLAFPLPYPLPFPLPRMSRRRRNLLLACCAIGAGGYVSYRVYKSASVTRKRLQLYRFFHSLSSLLEGAAQGSDCVGVLWNDLHSFLLSNEDEVPQSLKQLFKVGQTPEFQTSVALLCRSVTQGIVRSLSEENPRLQDGDEHGSALFEESSSQRGVGMSGRDSGDLESTVGRPSGTERRGYHKRSKLRQTENTSRSEGDEGADDEAIRPPESSTGAPTAEPSGNGERGRSRSPIGRRQSGEGRESEGLPERLLGKIFSEPGRGFASVVVASATRSLVLSVLEGIRETSFVGQTGRAAAGSPQQAEERNASPESQQSETNGVGSEDGEALKKPSRRSSSPSSSSSTFQDGMIDFLCSRKGKTLVADCIETFIGTAVSVYLDKTRDINTYDEILTAVSNPVHRDSVKDLLTSICNGALETLVRASHDAVSGPSAATSSSSAVPPQPTEAASAVGSRRDVRRLTFSLGKSSACFNPSDRSDVGDSGECGPCDGGNDSFVPSSPPPWSPDSGDSGSLNLPGLRTARIAFDHSPRSEKKVAFSALDTAVEEAPTPSSPSFRQSNGKTVVYPSDSREGSQGWIEGVSRTLAVPSNRALVLDVAGTVTAEAVRSAIDAVLCKMSLTLRGGKEEEQGSALDRHSAGGPSKVLRVVNRTGRLAQATASKALVAMTICLAICLHTLLGQSPVLERA